MEEQVKEQFAKFQNSWAAAIDNSSQTALHNSEVMLNSFGQLVKDQAELGRAWMDISRKQVESLSKDSDLTTLFSDKGAPAEYYAAAAKYGEALRNNVSDSFSRMATINREAAEKFVSACNQG